MTPNLYGVTTNLASAAAEYALAQNSSKAKSRLIRAARAFIRKHDSIRRPTREDILWVLSNCGFDENNFPDKLFESHNGKTHNRL